MKSLRLVFTLAVVSLGCAAGIAPASAAGAGAAAVPLGSHAVPSDLIKVHGWHCGERWAPGWGYHRHRGACGGYGYGWWGPGYGYYRGGKHYKHHGGGKYHGGGKHHGGGKYHGGGKHHGGGRHHGGGGQHHGGKGKKH